MRNVTIHDIGKSCKIWRRRKGYSQSDVARDTGYSYVNVSAFETGRNDNGMILLWYFLHGFTVADIFTLEG